MAMIIVVIATHALHTSDTVNRVTLELHKIDTSSSVELVLETSYRVGSCTCRILTNTPKAKQSNSLVCIWSDCCGSGSLRGRFY